MEQFEIKQGRDIPFFDHSDTLFATIRNSSRRRNMNIVSFVARKMKNYLLYRFSFFCPMNSMRIKMHKWRGVNIGCNVYIAMQCVIDNAYPEYIYIEDNVSIAQETMILAHSNPYKHFENVTQSIVLPVIIKNGAWLGVRSIILPGVTVGMNSIVSAGSVIDFNLPDRSVAAGNPGRIIARNLQTFNS
jgi:acetyltransferase-like isoleucine patch superfamily enzyme